MLKLFYVYSPFDYAKGDSAIKYALPDNWQSIKIDILICQFKCSTSIKVTVAGFFTVATNHISQQDRHMISAEYPFASASCRSCLATFILCASVNLTISYHIIFYM